MQAKNMLAWLHATITCSTIYSNKGLKLEDKSLIVKSEEPWKLLGLYKIQHSSNCAVLLVDNVDDFLKSIPFGMKMRTKVTFVLALASNSSTIHSNSLPPIHSDVHIIQLDKHEKVKGTKYIMIIE